ncbi:MAG: DUF1559 domain-containing protein, partial [Planctomycetaceae bacterium]|nr:DUF1559 domain-containing protein [Planctomycetaceae bacterium]
ISEIQDGTSNTVMVGEYARQTRRWTDHLVGWAQGKKFQFGRAHYHETDPQSMDQTLRYTINGPSDSTCVGTNVDCIKTHGWSYSSMHEGGAHFLLCDGSTRFINENINIPTFVYLNCAHDGQVVGEF